MIGAILPPGVTEAEVLGDGYDTGWLSAPEEAALAGAGQKRRREFTAVRVCARTAFERMGMTAVPVIPAPSGAPQWPPGIVGSMTHCEGYRACAIARADVICAVGIDAEPHASLPAGVLRQVAGQSEQQELTRLGRLAPEICWERILFSAKESVYKAWFPATGRWLGFQDAEVRIDPAGTFSARLRVPGPLVGGRPLPGYQGRWTVAGGLIATAVTVLAPTARPPGDSPA